MDSWVRGTHCGSRLRRTTSLKWPMKWTTMIGREGRRVVKEKGPEAHREREVRGEVHANYVGREADGIFYLHDKGCVFHLARPQGAMCSEPCVAGMISGRRTPYWVTRTEKTFRTRCWVRLSALPKSLWKLFSISYF
jgi:hypothetical protein